MSHETSETLLAWLNKPMSLLIVGMGNIRRGDDGVGIRSVDLMKEWASDRLMTLDCGESPEAFIDRMVSLKPSHVLIIDAMDIGESPGKVKLFRLNEIRSESFTSTHSIPLGTIADLIRSETEADIAVLGIQVDQTDWGSELSPSVNESLRGSIGILRDTLQDVGLLHDRRGER